MCLKYLNEQLKAFDALKRRTKKYPVCMKIVFAFVAVAVSVVVSCLVFFGPSLWKLYINGKWPFVQDHGEYYNLVEEFNYHLGQVNRTQNGIKELESALSALNEIKEIESKKILCIKDKKAIQLTEDFENKCDELKKHFNEMRFSDDEFVKREGEQLYNEVENINRKL